jgi:hypothetical protein
MVLPDAAAIFIKRDIQRPMQLILDIPMLTNHCDEGRGGQATANSVGSCLGLPLLASSTYTVIARYLYTR